MKSPKLLAMLATVATFLPSLVLAEGIDSGDTA